MHSPFHILFIFRFPKKTLQFLFRIVTKDICDSLALRSPQILRTYCVSIRVKVLTVEVGRLAVKLKCLETVPANTILPTAQKGKKESKKMTKWEMKGRGHFPKFSNIFLYTIKKNSSEANLGWTITHPFFTSTY